MTEALDKSGSTDNATEPKGAAQAMTAAPS